MAGTAILWPAIALAALTYAVWLRLFVARLGHIKANPPRGEDFATSAAAARYFQPVELPADNLRNLFEMPVLFYAATGFLFASGLASGAQVALACVYVVLRCGHSYEHIVTRRVMRRFQVYIASCAVLSAMWIGLAIDLARAG